MAITNQYKFYGVTLSTTDLTTLLTAGGAETYLLRSFRVTNNSIRNNMKMMEVANNPALSRYKKTQEFAPTKFYDPWAGPQMQQVGWNTSQKGMVESLKDLGFSAKEAYEKLSNKNKSKGLLFKDYPDPLQPEEFYDKWYGGSFDQLPSNKKGYKEVPQDVDTQIQNIYKGYI